MLTNDNSNYTKFLSYYYIGQFSKLIKPGAKRIPFSRFVGDIKMTAFKNTDGSIAVCMLNREHYNIEFNFCMNDITFKDTLYQQSMISYLVK